MKKKILLVLMMMMAALYLVGCGAEKPAAPDMQELFNDMLQKEGMPDMVEVPANQAYMLYGVKEEDCVQSIVALCIDSLRADEIWLIEAKDKEAAERIAELAQTRISQKGEELENYLPEQYKVVQKAALIKKDNCVAMIISPEVDALREVYDSAF